MAENTNNELAVRDAEVIAVTKPNDVVGFEIPDGYICTLDRNTVEGKLDIMNALNGAESLADHVGEVFDLKGFITTPGVRAVSHNDCTNTYLVMADGSTFMSQSDGVATCVRNLAAIFRQEDGTVKLGEDGTLPICCIEIPLKNGKTMKKLVTPKQQ